MDGNQFYFKLPISGVFTYVLLVDESNYQIVELTNQTKTALTYLVNFIEKNNKDVYTYNPNPKRQRYREKWSCIIELALKPIFEKYCK